MKEKIKFWEVLIWVLAVGGAIISLFWIIRTYTARSYDYGEQEQLSTNLQFIIQSPTIALHQDPEDINKYTSVKTYTSVYQVSDFDASKNEYYMVLNGKRIYNAKMDYGRVDCSLIATFLSTTGEDIITDSLVFTIDFNNSSTVITIETQGGETAFHYWQSFFNASGFDLRIYKVVNL